MMEVDDDNHYYLMWRYHCDIERYWYRLEIMSYRNRQCDASTKYFIKQKEYHYKKRKKYWRKLYL
jgi:hypothetical protein